MGRSLVALGLVAAALAAAATAYSARARRADRPDLRPKPFVVRAAATGLYPGASRPLVVLVENPNRRPIRLVSLDVQVRDASPACGRENVIRPGYHGRFVVSARSRRLMTLRIGMRRTAPDACQGATFQLVLTGRAVAA
jgi:hypothetical protein